MAVNITRGGPTQLPPFRLPAGHPNRFALNCPSGPWEDYPWTGRATLGSDADRHPVVWARSNCHFLNFALHPPAPNPARLYLPRRGYGVPGCLLKPPRVVLYDFPLIDRIVALLGEDVLDEAGIALVNVDRAGTTVTPDFGSWNSLRYGLPCHSVDEYEPPFADVDFPDTVHVGHADTEQFVGGEMLALTRAQNFYAFQSVEFGRPYRYDSAGVAHDVAELNRCRPRFFRVRWIHNMQRTPEPLDPTLDERFLDAVAAAGSADVVGNLVDWQAADAAGLAFVANAVREFFNL